MEEILPNLKKILKEAIDLKMDALKLAISLTIKKNLDDIVAKPGEIIAMLKMYGRLREDVHMEIEINNDAQTIVLKFHNEEDFNKVEKIMETIWDNAVNMLVQVMEGDFRCIKDIPNIDD